MSVPLLVRTADQDGADGAKSKKKEEKRSAKLGGSIVCCIPVTLSSINPRQNKEQPSLKGQTVKIKHTHEAGQGAHRTGRHAHHTSTYRAE